MPALGTGHALQTALDLLRGYAANPYQHPDQVDHVRFCISQAEKDWNELLRQRDHARDVACQLEQALADQRGTLPLWMAQPPKQGSSL